MAAVTAAGLGAYPMLRAGALGPLVDVLGALALLFVLAAILVRGRFVGAALFLLATAYVLVEATGRAPAASVIAYAPGLAALCELLLLASELPRSASTDPAVVADRLVVIAATAIAGALLALVALAATGLRLPGAFAAALLGAAAAAALLALPLLLLRRLRAE